MSRFRIWRNYYLGTGMLTVVGTSFATLSTASAVSVILHPIESHAEVSKDLQRSVLQRHMPINNGGRWYGHATSLPRCLWICPWYDSRLYPRISFRRSNRNIYHLCFPRNFHVLGASEGPSTDIPSNGDRNRHPIDWCFSRRRLRCPKLGRGV